MRLLTKEISGLTCMREHLTSDSFKSSKFLAMLLAIRLDLGWTDALLREDICSMRNFWKSLRWVRVEVRLSALDKSSNNF